MSVSCIQGYKSAIKWFYEQQHLTLDASINNWLDKFIKGYKRIVNDKKQRGIMAVFEGM
jgi:hypothetical protein